MSSQSLLRFSLLQDAKNEAGRVVVKVRLKMSTWPAGGEVNLFDRSIIWVEDFCKLLFEINLII